MKRIQEIDFLRGFSILAMLFFHGSYYWASLPNKEQMTQMLSNPFAGLALLLGKAAGIFALISGMSNAISMHHRLKSGKSKPKQIFLSGLIIGLWVIIIGKIQVSVFNHTLIGNAANPYPNGPPNYSLIVGSIETGTLQLPSIYTLLYKNTALTAIGLSIIVTGIILALLGLKEGYKKVKRNLIIIGITATCIILLTDIMIKYLRPIWLDAYLNNKHLLGTFLGIFIGDSYPFFPFAGYALYGAMFGIAFAENLNKKKVITTGMTAGGIYVISGSILLAILGNPPVETIFQTLPMQWNYLQIGVLIFISTLIFYVHYLKKESRLKRVFQSRTIRRFGLLTLTIFVFEPLVGATIKKLVLDPLFPNWSQYAYLAFGYGVALIFFWQGLLKMLERVQFKGTIEWLNGKITSVLTKRDASRLNIYKNLYGEEQDSKEEITKEFSKAS